MLLWVLVSCFTAWIFVSSYLVISASAFLQSTTTDDRKKCLEGRGEGGVGGGGRRKRDMYTITEVAI